MKKKCFALLLACMLLAACLSCAAQEAAHTRIAEISKYGNIDLALSGSELLSLGYDYADIITAEIQGKAYDMPIGSSYSDVDDGGMICRVKIDAQTGEDRVTLAINMGDFASSCGIAKKTDIPQEPGYRWTYAQDTPAAADIILTMKEKGGYAGAYSVRQLTRTNSRADYPHLTDAQYANFRAVATGGMGKGVLYRASSPIDPQLGRSTFADAALEAARVRSVINLTDTPRQLRAYPGYGETAYAACDVLALGLNMDVQGDAFKQGFAGALRFMLSHDAPYLIHCTEGKDRTGFVCAVLSCLMGATAQEVIADYMTTYEQYYGTQKDSESYQLIAQSNICKSLAAAFGMESLTQPDADLAAYAADYLQKQLGLSEAEIEQLKARLASTIS